MFLKLARHIFFTFHQILQLLTIIKIITYVFKKKQQNFIIVAANNINIVKCKGKSSLGNFPLRLSGTNWIQHLFAHTKQWLPKGSHLSLHPLSWYYYLSLFSPKNKNNNQKHRSSYHSDFKWNHFFFRKSRFLPVQVPQKVFVSWITVLTTLPHTDPQPD